MIQSDDIILHPMNPPEVPNQHRGDRSQKHAVRRHEIEKAPRRRQDAPGHQDPREQGAEQLPAADVDVGREERGEVVGRGQAIGRDVDAERGEEATGAVRPVGDEGGRVPVQGAVVGVARGGAGDADEGDEREDEGQQWDVEPLPVDAGFAVAGEVGHVDAEGAVIADDLVRRQRYGSGLGM